MFAFLISSTRNHLTDPAESTDAFVDDSRKALRRAALIDQEWRMKKFNPPYPRPRAAVEFQFKPTAASPDTMLRGESASFHSSLSTGAGAPLTTAGPAADLPANGNLRKAGEGEGDREPQGVASVADAADGAELSDADAAVPLAPVCRWGSPDFQIFEPAVEPEPVWGEFFGCALDEELATMAAHMQVPYAVAAVSFIVIASGLIGHRLEIPVKFGWTERMALWAVIIAGSGSGKSSVTRIFVPILKGLEEQEAVPWAERLRELDRHNLVADITQSEYKRRLRAAVLDGGELPQQPEILPIGLPTRQAPQLIIDDVTLPALAEAHAHPMNVAGLLALPDEMAPVLDRISQRPDERAAFLRAHDGGHYRVDRRTRGQIDIRNFCVSILASAVPGHLALGKKADGFSARCLWIPYNPVRTTPLPSADFAAPVTHEVLARVRQLAREAAQEPLRLPLSKEAHDAFEEVAAEWNSRARDARGHLSTWYARAPTQILRLAGMREVCRAAHAGEMASVLSVASIDAAAAAVEQCFAPMARHVLGVPAAPDETPIVKFAQIIAMQAETDEDGRLFVNKRLVRRKFGERLSKGADFHALWRSFEEAGLLRELPRTAGKRGRKAGDFELNPAFASL
jgi:hypothetical protein